MIADKTVTLIIPARNEAKSLPSVFKEIPQEIDHILLIDNGSTDATAQIATDLGAEVIYEPVKGYGQACLTGLDRLKRRPTDIVAFADADGSDNHAYLLTLVKAIAIQECDLALSCRISTSPQSLSPQQRFGNWLATRLIWFFWGYHYQDLGPMRALSWSTIEGLEMRDTNFGWTVEMQIKAAQRGLRTKEYAIPYRPRIAGQSKISRTVSGVLKAGSKILWVIFREAAEGLYRRVRFSKNSNQVS